MSRVLVALFVVLLAAPMPALGAWSGRVEISPASLEFGTATRTGETYDLVSVRPDYGPRRAGLDVIYPRTPGEPLLPAWTLTIVIPQGMRVASLEAVPDRVVELPGRFRLMPAQQPVPVSTRDLPTALPLDAAIAASDAAWPAAWAEVGPVGVKSGFRLVTITLTPLRWHARSGQLELATGLAIRVDYEPDPSARPEQLSERQLARFAPAVRALVFNPAEVRRHAPAVRATDFGDIDCVILTSTTLAPAFAPLVSWHTRKGFKTETRTTAWVYSNYSGRDNQERIRNFVRDYYNNEGLMWLLLGGDTAVVPTRRARAVVSGEVGNIPCDLYYADLQWSWDGNNNNIFGEANVDTVDLYYDLYVGRASVDDTIQVNTLINKILTHEQNPPTDYLRRMLLADAPLWTGYDHTQSNDSIAAITPAGWTDVFIHSPTNTTTIRDSINHGFQFVHIVGHGNEVGIYNGSTNMYGTNAASAQTNGDRVNLVNSIACYPGNFEYSDCLAEAAHNRRGGGSVAVIMNSRYGWGTPPNIGPSEKLDIRFYDYFFNHATMPIGITHAASKEVYRNTAINMQVWRWCYYELNLFADPLLVMYENVPGTLALTFTSPIATGSQNYTVTVRSGGSTLAGALVCLQKGTEVYARDYTNSSGQVTLAIDPTTAGYMQITATAANHLPAYDSCQVVATLHDIAADRILAPTGNVVLGTVVTPQAVVRNLGSATETNVPVRLRIGTGYTDNQTIGSIAAGDSAVVSFTGWTATPVGGYLVRCSTGLAGDMQPDNDTASAAANVYELRDVATTAIIAPTGTVDSGQVIIPQARVRNNGSAAASFPVIFRIGTGYTDTSNVSSLNPGDSAVVSFAGWTAGSVGVYAVSCSTALLNDSFPANNRLTGSVTVGFRDVAVTAILSPAGTFDSTATRSVQARVRNNGTTTVSFPVLFRITGPVNWSDTATVSNLAPGNEVTVNFASWTIGPRGTYAAACSTRLTGDGQNGNDRATGEFVVRVRDAAAIGFAAPAALVDSGEIVPVRPVVANYGSVASNVGVRVVLGSGYAEQLVVLISAATVDTVDLPDWTVTAGRGNVLARCSTWVTGDIDPANDVCLDTVFVAVRDVGVTELIAPTGTVDSGVTITPRARVRNHGNLAADFTVRFTIADGYVDTRPLTLLPGQDTALSFADWVAATPGFFAVRCSTRMVSDFYPANNRLTGSVNVAGTDVGVVAILAPGAGIFPGLVNPAARWRNYSPAAKDFTVWLSIADSLGAVAFADSAAVVGLARDSSVDVVFASWDAAPGRYALRCSTWIAGDVNPANDTAGLAVRVYRRDVGVEAIVFPVGVIRPMSTSPVIRVANYGDGPESFWGHLVIEDSVSGALAYRDSVYITGVDPGEHATRSLPGWTATLGYFRLTGWTAAGGDADRSNDTARARLVCTPGALGWQAGADLPPGAKPVKQGGCLTGLETDTARIYCLKGNKTFEFYGYNAATGEWTALAALPPGPSGKPVKKGAALCADGERYVYALKGNKTFEFWRFDTHENEWLQLADLPAGARKLADGAGLAFASIDGLDYVYCLKGSKTLEFLRYEIAGGAWEILTDAPAGPRGKVFKKGSAFGAGNEGLYALKGGTNEFYRYDTDRGEWTARAEFPAYSANSKRNKAKDGCALAGDGTGFVYAFAGGNRQYFFAYGEAPDQWAEIESLPRLPSGRRVKSGAALGHSGRRIWALKGNKTLEFWVYTPDTMALLGIRPGRGGVAGAPVPTGTAGLQLGPNPARAELRLVAGAGAGPARAELLNALGAVVAERTILPRALARIPVGHLPAGSYFLRVEQDGVVLTRKVVINR
ncbi:MAG: C25 family cysteine peptidase [bacterium]